MGYDESELNEYVCSAIGETRTRLDFNKDGSLKPMGTYKSLVIPACEYNGMPAVYINKPFFAKRRKFLSAVNKWAIQIYTLSFDELRWTNHEIEGYGPDESPLQLL